MRLSQEGYWAILRKELDVAGTWNSEYRDLPRNEWNLALEFMAEGRLDVTPLVTHRIGLAALPDHLARLRDHTEFANKVLYVDGAGD